MKQRFNLWLADWRDEKGRRHRKGFPTKKQAQCHQDKMKRSAAEKSAVTHFLDAGFLKSLGHKLG